MVPISGIVPHAMQQPARHETDPRLRNLGVCSGYMQLFTKPASIIGKRQVGVRTAVIESPTASSTTAFPLGAKPSCNVDRTKSSNHLPVVLQPCERMGACCYKGVGVEIKSAQARCVGNICVSTQYHIDICGNRQSL